MANISKKLKFILFADHTTVFYADKNLVDVMGVLNYELKNLNVWFKVNKLSLNVGKTNSMIFKRKNDNIDHQIITDGVHVERVHVTKYLGVKADEHLNWDDQINSVCRNLSKYMSVSYIVNIF